MVSSAHQSATEAGLEMLRLGGNAFDAAVAIAAALNVVEPMMSGIGGYGTILVYAAEERKCRFLNTSDRFPRSVDSDMFRPPTPGYETNRRGPKAISTPGNVRGWQAMSQTYGRLPWSRLLQPASSLAGEGFPVGVKLAEAIRRNYAFFPEHAKGIYGRNERPLQEDDTLIQRDLAGSLSQIAEEGPDVLYGGALGKRIAEAVRREGGFLAMADLEQCATEWWEPATITYRGHKVCVPSPPATSFPALIRLGLMSQFDVRSLGHNSVPYLHRFAEVTKHAYRCRLRHAADPGIGTVPLNELLSYAYCREVASHLNTAQAEPFTPPSGTPESSLHTTHFVVADGQGNIVSATQTIGQLFGSRIIPPGTGIWLNNSLQYCTFEPKGNPMDAHAGRRKLSGDCPTIIFRDEVPWAALGTPGGHTIPQTVPQIVMNLIDFEMDMAEAIAQPRISFGEPDQLLVDTWLPSPAKEALAAMGHNIHDVSDGLGNAHGLTIEYDEAKRPVRFTGAADPRGEGSARGL
jgi:gamma-glutamyltranspeptidase/glutathione hydrolase